MNADTPITSRDLRKQGARLVEIGRQYIAAGEKQIEAAKQIEASYTLLSQGFSRAELPPPVDDTENGVHRYSRREYISAVDAVRLSLKDGLPKDITSIYECVISMGARCKDEKSRSLSLSVWDDKCPSRDRVRVRGLAEPRSGWAQAHGTA